MASPGRNAPAGTKINKRHYRKNRRSKASKVMMDQQNFEATRPVSADPAVALAEALGQLPQSRQDGKAKAPAKTSVESWPGTRPQARRPERADHPPHQARQGLFIRSRQRHPIRHTGTIKRLHSMAVPPAYREVRYSPDPNSHLQAVGRDAAGRLQYRYHADWEKVREQRKAHRLARLVGALPKIRRNVSMHLSGDEPTREFALARR
jgi:DNA topoisomerase-1